MEDVTYESGVQLLQNYPNPAVDNTRIQYRLDETMDITFEVYDMAGKLVYTEDMGNVPAGAVQNFQSMLVHCLLECIRIALYLKIQELRENLR